MAAVRPDLLVELGTHYGESYFGFCQAVAENNIACNCYAIDTWLGEPHSGFYDEAVYQDVSAYNDANYSTFSRLIRTTFDDARQRFSDNSVDIVHIDGLHTYDAVRRDLENWLPAVKPGGIILLHDISARHSDFGVWKVWAEMEKLGERFDFLHSWGLGVFRKPGGDETSPFLAALFSGPEDRRTHIRRFYALCARSLEHEHFRVSAQDAQRARALLQVYPANDRGYSAQFVCESFFSTKVWEHVRVDLLSGSLCGKFRIDITEFPGVIDVAGVSVRKKVNDECIFRAVGAKELAALEVGGTMARFEDSGSTEFCRFISSGNDPQLYLELDSNLTDQPLVLDLWVRADSEVTLLLPSLTARQNERLNDANARRSATIEFEKQANNLKQQLDAARSEHETSTSAHRRLQGEVYVMKRDLAQARENNDRLNAEIEKSKESLASIAEQQTVAQSSYAELARQHQALRERNQELDRTIQGILCSRSWRLTSPLRRLAGGVRNA